MIATGNSTSNRTSAAYTPSPGPSFQSSHTHFDFEHLRARPALANAQFHNGDNFVFQETQTKLTGSHALRYGIEFLRQLVTQQRGANDLGSVQFQDAVGYSGFANFLDDFSGPSASISRTFGAKVLHPDHLRQSYFFQDNWKITPALALTAELRYENFGQPANALPYPAFTGFDPAHFLARREINPDNRDFGRGGAWRR